MKNALVTGISGQDGSYLAEFLLSEGYTVHGIIRRSSTYNIGRLREFYDTPRNKNTKLFLHYGDLTDSECISNILNKFNIDEIYHLGAQSHVRVSFDLAEYTAKVVALGTTRILEAARRNYNPIKVYQASSSEMYGDAIPPQHEDTKFSPRSPYACAKVYSYFMARNYRNGYGMFVSNGILFNHESPRRGETFVTRKITRGVASILAKKTEHLYLGNLDAVRDWGYAPEYVECMYDILQHPKPQDFVLGTGEAHTISECVDLAFSYAGLDKEKYVKTDPRYLRPTETAQLIANPDKAKRIIGWKPKIRFESLIKIMVDSDMRLFGIKPIGEGDEIIKRTFPNRWWKAD